MPGRKKKFRIGEVVVYDDQPCAVVDYRQDRRKRGSYRLVRLSSLPSGRGYGPAIWVESWEIQGQAFYPDRRWKQVQTYRANQKLVDRGCECQCCVHTALDAGMVLGDGTYAWEGE